MKRTSFPLHIQVGVRLDDTVIERTLRAMPRLSVRGPRRRALMSRLQVINNRRHRQRGRTNHTYRMALVIWRDARHALLEKIGHQKDLLTYWGAKVAEKNQEIGALKARIGEVRAEHPDPAIKDNLRGLMAKVTHQREQMRAYEDKLAAQQSLLLRQQDEVTLLRAEMSRLRLAQSV